MANTNPNQGMRSLMPEKPDELYQFDAHQIERNKFAKRIDESLELYGKKATLGVEAELKKFAKNEYFKTRNDQILVGTDDNAVEDEMTEDDLLLTNAITENRAQDTIDKTRYFKETRNYVVVNSAARLTASDVPPPSGEILPSLYSTGSTPVNDFTFAPFDINGPSYEENVAARYDVVNQVVSDGSQNLAIGTTLDYTANQPPTDVTAVYTPFDIGFAQTPGNVIITSETNLVNFTSQDVTANSDFVTDSGNTLFYFFIPVGSYTLAGLQTAIQSALDGLLDQTFTVTVTSSDTINPGRANINITTQYSIPLSDKVTYTMNWVLPQNQSTAAPSPLTSDGTIIEPVTAPDGVPLSILAAQGSITYFPNPNNYILELDRAPTNVKAIRVVSSEIPNTDTIINLANSGVAFLLIDADGNQVSPSDPQDAGILVPSVVDTDPDYEWDYFIPVGNYTPTELATTLQAGLNSLVSSDPVVGPVVGDNLFSVSVNTNTGIFTIAVNNGYSIIFGFVNNPDLGWRNLWQMLGFPSSDSTDPAGDYFASFDNTVQLNANTVANPVYVSVAYGSFNLRVSNFIWMYLNGYENIFDTYSQNYYFAKFSTKNVSANGLLVDTFAPIPMVFIDSPVPSIGLLTISFFDETGLPYNFNNVDHTICLEFTCHTDRFMGADYSSQRGAADKSSYI